MKSTLSDFQGKILKISAVESLKDISEGTNFA